MAVARPLDLFDRLRVPTFAAPIRSLETVKFLLVRHEPAVLTLDLVLHDVSGSVALPDGTAAPSGSDRFSLAKCERGFRAGFIQGLERVSPMNQKRSDPVNLHHRPVRV